MPGEHGHRAAGLAASLWISLLSVFSCYLSIGFIVAVQLNAAITPRIWRLDRF